MRVFPLRVATSLVVIFLGSPVLLHGTSAYARQDVDDSSPLRFREVAENSTTDDNIKSVLSAIEAKDSSSNLPTSITLVCGGSNPTNIVMSGDLSHPTPHSQDVASDPIIALDTDGHPLALCPTSLGGDIVKNAYTQVDSSGDLSVGVTLTDRGSINFTMLIGKPLNNQIVAIVINSQVISAPSIQPDLANGLTANQLQITLGASKNEKRDADNLVKILNSGSNYEPISHAKSSSHSLIIAGVLIFVVVAVGTVVGGFVVMRKRKDDSFNNLVLPSGLNPYDQPLDVESKEKDLP